MRGDWGRTHRPALAAACTSRTWSDRLNESVPREIRPPQRSVEAVAMGIASVGWRLPGGWRLANLGRIVAMKIGGCTGEYLALEFREFEGGTAAIGIKPVTLASDCRAEFRCRVP